MFYIYRITNLVNGKTYIGQHKYKKLDDNYMGSGTYLARAKKKYGIENFKKEILYSNIQYKETADDMERFAIAKERAIGKGEYNLADGGGGPSGLPAWNKGKKGVQVAWNKGVPMSEEQKKKCSEALKGKPSSRKGVSLSEEEKTYISIKTKEAMTEDVRKKISEKKKGKPSQMKGKHHTEESKQKMRESHKGQVAWNKGVPMSDEQKTHLSELNKGKINPIMQEMREAYRKSGRKDWNAFQKEYRKGDK